jgi:hypothetical protein
MLVGRTAGLADCQGLLGTLGAMELLRKAGRVECLLACCCATTTTVQRFAYQAVYDGRVE